MRSRLLRPILLALLVGGAVLFWHTTLRPEPKRLSAWADDALRDLFGPDVAHGEVRVDLLEGVVIRDLSVRSPGTTEPALWADEVVLQHDVLALSAGIPRLREVVLRGPQVSIHETDTGELALDFPFDLPKSDGAGFEPPSIVIERGVFRLKASPTSKTFRSGYELVLGNLDARATPGPDGTLTIVGHFLPRDVGLSEGEEITFQGTANPSRGILDVYAVWERLRLTPAVRGILAPSLMEGLETQRLADGPHRLAIHLARDPAVESGRIRVSPQFRGTMKVDIAGLPGTENIDAATRDQINALFGQLNLTIEMTGGRIDVRELSTSLAGGVVTAVGRIEDGGEFVDLDLKVTGLRLDDPALLKALGPIAQSVLAQVAVRGTVDATLTLRRARGGPMRWEAAIDLVDATLSFLGKRHPDKKTPSGGPFFDGFPYAAEHCFGRIYVSPEGARVDAIEGRHGQARIRVRGRGETARGGGPTGTVTWEKGDTDVILTIEAVNMPIDRDLEAAVEGSEFAGLLDVYRPSGSIRRVVVDVVKRPNDDDVAVVELDVDLENVGFRYSKFPIDLEGVTGRVSLLRPVLPDGTRGKEFHARAKALAAEGVIGVTLDLLETQHAGRVQVTATGVRVEGPLTEAVLRSEVGKGDIGLVLEYLKPKGRIDVVADLPVGGDPGPERFAVRLKGASLRLGDPATDHVLEVADLQGTVKVVGGNATIHGVGGRIGESPLTLEGTFDGGTGGAWDLHLSALSLRLEEAILGLISDVSGAGGALPPGIVLEPGGRLDLDLRLKRPPGVGSKLTAAVAISNAELTARIGDMSMRVRGGFSVDGDDVRLENIVAEGRGIRIEVPKARWGPKGLEGGFNAKLTDVVVGPEVLDLLPASLRSTIEKFTRDRLLQADDLTAVVDDAGAMTVRGALGLKARPGAPGGGAPRGLVEFAPLLLSAPDPKGAREVHGTVLLQDLDLDVGTHLEEVRGRLDVERFTTGDDPEGRAKLRLETVRVAGFLLEALEVPLEMKDGILAATPLAATLYGGRLSSTVRVHTREPFALEGNLDVAGLALEGLMGDLGGGPDVRGDTAIHLEFQSRSSSISDFTAAGTVSVCGGDLGELPPVANIPALFANIFPAQSKPRFERAEIAFTISDEKVRADCLRLSGPIFDLDGFGTLSFSGNLDVTLTPQFVKSLLLPGSLQIPGVRSVVGLFREDPLYVVRLRGNIATAKPVIEPLPFIGPHPKRPDFDGMPFLTGPERRMPHLFR